MAIEYAIEQLQETGSRADRAQAAVLAGVLAARGGKDIPLPDDGETGHNDDLALNRFLGASATLELVDDSDKTIQALSIEELDQQSRNRYEVSNAAKVALHPFYIAASRKVPLATNNPKSFRGKPKSGIDSVGWTATTRVGNYKPVTVSTDMNVEYLFGPSGNLATKLTAQVHKEGLKPSRKDPKVAISFDNQAASNVYFSRGKYDLIHRSLDVLPSWFAEVMEFDANLDPNNLSLTVKHTDPQYDSEGLAGNAVYDYDHQADAFYPHSYKESKFINAKMPHTISRAQFMELLQQVSTKAFPAKQKEL